MDNNTVDLLQIKIENAKKNLPEETSNAIAAVDWRAAILGLRQKKGYNFEQLADLELETELVLCGLLNSEDYPKEIENRMRISKAEANEVVNEMNNLVFKKIKEELIKNSERKKIFAKQNSPQDGYPKGEMNNMHPPRLSATPQEGNKNDTKVLNSAGINIIPISAPDASKVTESREDILQKVENPEAKTEIHPLLAQKLFASSQVPTVKTEHTMENITPASPPAQAGYPPKKDPYRLAPDE